MENHAILEQFKDLQYLQKAIFFLNFYNREDKCYMVFFFTYHDASSVRNHLRETFSSNDFFILGSAKHKSWWQANRTVILQAGGTKNVNWLLNGHTEILEVDKGLVWDLFWQKLTAHVQCLTTRQHRTR